MSALSSYLSDAISKVLDPSYEIPESRSGANSIYESITSNSELTNSIRSSYSSASDFVNENFSNGISFLNGDNNLIQNLSEWLLGANPATTREWNSAEAQKERDWQTEMSNTAYQRATVDMQKAGINPILAYSQGGASSGTGAVASSSPNSAGSIAPIISSIGQILLGFQKEDRLSDKQAADSAMSALKFADSHSANEVYMNLSKAQERLTHARASLSEDDMRRRYKRSR